MSTYASLIILGVFILVGVPAFFYFTLKKIDKNGSEVDKSAETSKKDLAVTEKYVEQVVAAFNASLDVTDALDEILKFLKDRVRFSVGAYIVNDSKDSLDFKAHVFEEVSSSFIEELQGRLLSEYRKTCALGEAKTKNFPVQRIVEGRTLPAEENTTVQSILTFPIKIGDICLGIFSVATHKQHYLDTKKADIIDAHLNEALRSLSGIIEVVNREKKKLQDIVNSMDNGVMMVDKSLRVLVVNPSLSTLLNGEIISSITDVSTYFSSKLSLDNEISKVFLSGAPNVLERVKIGERFYEVRLLPIKSGNDVTRVGVLVYDRTKEEELDRIKREFSAMVIHELRSPLTVLKGTASLLKRRSAELNPEEVLEFYGQIEASADNLLDKVNDLLDSAKIEEGKIELFMSSVDINNLLASTKYYYDNLAVQQGASLRIVPDSTLVPINADIKKLQQVLNNLVSNALKYTSKSGQVIIESKNEGDLVKISVSDNGEGVPDDLKDKIFEKYVQGKEGKKGTGLGLVIARGIVEAHGGNLWVEDNEPKGAKFVFTISANLETPSDNS